jgi:hypothetical protein
MMNYELVRAIQLERERDVERSVRARSLRAAITGTEDTREARARDAGTSNGRSRLLAARSR